MFSSPRHRALDDGDVREAGASDARSAIQAISGRRIAQMIETDGPGGAERMVAQLARGLVSVGCPSVVVVPAEGEGWIADQLAGSNVAIERVHLEGRTSVRCLGELAAVFRRHQIDLVHSHEFTMGVFGTWAARRAGLPHVITMHGGRYHASRGYRRLAMRTAVRFSGGVVAVSSEVGNVLSRDLRLPPGAVRVIPNGVLPAPRGQASVRQELGLVPTDRLVLSVGNLYEVKGHRYLLDALAEVAGAHPAVHVAIAGRGGEEPALRARAAALGIAHRVHLLGFRSDIGGLLAAANAFVLPSLSEGLPLALLEAMFSGLPIVATDVGEVRAVLEPDAGIVVPPADAAALAAAIARIMRDPDEAARLGKNAERRAAADFHFDRTLERYAALYAERLAAR